MSIDDTDPNIIWARQSFLASRKFQEHNPYWDQHVADCIQGASPYFWGISHLTINRDFLRYNMLTIHDCQGALQVGTSFNLPNKDALPVPLDIPVDTRKTLVYLAAKLAPLDTTDPDYDPRFPKRYIDMPNGRLLLQLLLEKDVTEDYVGVAITRIQEIDRQKGVILDEQFLPACLEIQIIPGLCKRFAEFLALLRVCGDILAERMNNDTMSDIVKTLNLMQLQEINRSEAGLTLRFDQPHLHPYILFGSLIELAASLATFTEPERRLQEEFQYHHKDPIKTFEPLFEKATQILNIIMEGGHNN